MNKTKESKIETVLTKDLKSHPQWKQMELNLHLDGLGLFLFDREHPEKYELMHAKGYLNKSSDETIEADISEVIAEVDKLKREGYNLNYAGPRTFDEYCKREEEVSELMRSVLSPQERSMVEVSMKITDELSRPLW